MKFLFPAIILGLCSLPVSAQEEISMEEVLQKLEARLAPIESVSGRILVRGGSEFSGEVDIAGWICCRPGKSFQKEIVVWKVGEGMFLKENYYLPSSIATRGIFTGNRKGQGFCFAFTAPPGELQARSGGMMGMMEMLVGNDWMLWDLALWPRQVFSRYSNLKAHVKEGSLIVRGEWNMPRMFQQNMDPIQLEWTFNSSTYRIEKMVANLQKEPVEILCREYLKIQGVEIPCRVEYSEGGFPGLGSSRVSLILDQVQSPALPDHLEGPEWLKDPALPEVSTLSVEELEEKLKADPTNGALVMQLANQGVVGLTLEGGSAEDLAKKVGEYTKPALDANPESALLRLSWFLSGVMADGTIPEDRLEAIIKGGALTFDALSIAILYASGEKKVEKAKKLLSLIPNRGAAGEFRRRVGFQMELLSISSAADFMGRINRELEGCSVSEKLSVLSGIAPPFRRFGRGSQVLAQKPAEFLNKLADSGKPEFQLLAARGFAGQGENAQSVKLYVVLAGHPEYASLLTSEFQAVCKRGGEEAAPLMEKIMDQIDDPELLLVAVASVFEKKDELRFLQLKKRLIKVCEEKGDQGYRNTDKLIPLLKSLVEVDRIGDAKDLLLAYVTKSNASRLTYGEPSKLLSRILAGDFDAKFRFLKYAGAQSGGFRKLGIKVVDFVAEIGRRVEGGKAEKSDFDSLGALLLARKLESKSGVEMGVVLSLLRKGTEQYPSDITFRERLGDAHYFAKEYDSAISAYEEVLRMRLEQKKGGENRGMEGPQATAIRHKDSPVKPTFGPEKKVLEKISYAFLAQGDREGAVRAVEQFLEDFPGGSAIPEAAAAYKVLGMEERILPLKKRLFLEQVRSKSRRGWGDPVLKTGIELVELYMKAEKYLEANLVAGIVWERKVEQGDADAWARLEKKRAEIRGKLTSDLLIREFLKMEFAPLSASQKVKIDELIEQMDADQIDLRDEAFNQLGKMGKEISPYLAGELEGQSAEVAGRLREILVGHARKALREQFLKE